MQDLSWNNIHKLSIKFSAGIVIAAGISLGLSCGIYYIFKHPINQIISRQGSDVAKQIVISSDVQIATETLLKQILNDESIKKHFLKLVTDVLNDEKIFDIAKKNIINLLENNVIQNNINVLLLSIIENNDIKHALKDLIKYIYTDYQIKTAAIDLIMFITNDENIKINSYKFVQNIIIKTLEDIDIHNRTVEFITKTIKITLNNPLNEKFIKNKLKNLIISDEVIYTTISVLTETIQKEDFKHLIGDNIVDALVISLKNRFPYSYGLFV